MASRFVIGFLLFVFITGALIGIYSATQNQPTIYNPQSRFNDANRGIAGNRTNPIIVQGSNSTNLTVAGSGNSTKTITGSTCTSTNILGQLFCAFVAQVDQLDVALCNAFPTVGGCATFNNPVRNVIGSSLGADVQSTQIAVKSNPVMQILQSPAGTALGIAITFIALGILAGTFGAGILANVMGRVGIAIALFYYINAQMSLFGSITDYWFDLVILGPLNVLMAIGSIVLIQESLGGGKAE